MVRIDRPWAKVSTGGGGSSVPGAPLVGGDSGTGLYDAAAASSAASTAEAGKAFVYNFDAGQGEGGP